MTTTGNVAGIVPGLMGIALVGESMKMLPKDMTGFNRSKSSTKMNSRPFAMNHKKQNGKMIKGFGNIMVGSALIGGTAGMINNL